MIGGICSIRKKKVRKFPGKEHLHLMRLQEWKWFISKKYKEANSLVQIEKKGVKMWKLSQACCATTCPNGWIFFHPFNTAYLPSDVLYVVVVYFFIDLLLRAAFQLGMIQCVTYQPIFNSHLTHTFHDKRNGPLLEFFRAWTTKERV